MQVSVESSEGLERRMTVELPAERVDEAVEKRLKEVARTIKLDGFRPGKVPMSVVRKQFKNDVRQEVFGDLVQSTYFEALTQEELVPAGEPSAIEPADSGDGEGMAYTAVFEVMPEVVLNDLGDVKVTRTVAEVTDPDLDEMIEKLRQQRTTWNVVDREAQNEDQATVNFKGFIDGEAFEGGSADSVPLVLGSGRMIPGFEDGIAGMKAGDEKTLELTFPEEYHSEDLKGAAVEFKVTLNKVEEMVPAPLDENLFSQYGVEDGGEEQFRKEVGENMARELKNAVETKVKQQVMDAVLAAHEAVEIPQSLIAQEVDVLRNQMFQQFGGAGGQDMDLKSLLPDDMFTENAEKRVKLGLVLSELIGKFELKADGDKVRETIEEMASTYQEPEEVINYYYSNQEQLSSIESRVLEDQVVEKLLESAKIAEKECSYQDAIAPAQQEEA